ncbi:MAG: glutamate racemase [Deinococcales bacterium]
MRESPIGVFDSGVGGLTVLRAMRELLPHEDFIYLADTARFPYGRKPKAMIAEFSAQNIGFLESQGAKLIVIACNTASTCADLSAATVPVIGVIEPGVLAASAASNGGVVGVLATRGTIASGAYQSRLRARGHEVWAKSCPMLAPLVEEGLADSLEARLLIEYYLLERPKNLDALILGCTHYPVLKNAIAQHLGDTISVVDSAFTAASVVKKELEQRGLGRSKHNGTIKHFITGDPQSYQHTAAVIGGVDGAVQHIEIETLVGSLH